MNIRLLLLMPAILLVLSGCTDYVSRMKHIAESTDKLCPLSLGTSGDLLSVTYDEKENKLLMNVSINDDEEEPDYGGINYIQSNREHSVESFKLMLSRKEMKSFIEPIVKVDAQVQVIYKDVSTTKTAKLYVSPNELSDLLNNPISEKELTKKLYKDNIAFEDALCPYMIDEGFTMMRAYDDGDNAVYSIQMEDLDDLYSYMYTDDQDIDDFEASLKEFFKEGMFSKEALSDPASREDLEIHVALGKGFVIMMYDMEGYELRIEFTPEELKEILNSGS